MKYQCKNCLNIFTYYLKYIVHQQYQMCKRKTPSMIKKKYYFKIEYYKNILNYLKTKGFNK